MKNGDKRKGMWSKGKRISWIDEEKVNEKKDQKSTLNPNHIPLNTSKSTSYT